MSTLIDPCMPVLQMVLLVYPIFFCVSTYLMVLSNPEAFRKTDYFKCYLLPYIFQNVFSIHLVFATLRQLHISNACVCFSKHLLIVRIKSHLMRLAKYIYRSSFVSCYRFVYSLISLLFIFLWTCLVLIWPSKDNAVANTQHFDICLIWLSTYKYDLNAINQYPCVCNPRCSRRNVWLTSTWLKTYVS